MKIDQKKTRQVHRWVGLIFSVSALMASSSGVLHNVMSRTQSPPPEARPAGLIKPDDVKVSIPQAVSKLPDPSVKLQAVSIRSIGDEPWYQLFVEGTKDIAYVSALDGRYDPNQDEVYASEIASRYLGGAHVRKTDYLKTFNNEYINIFRILPVYRFETQDGKGTRVYVSTMTGSVTRHTDDQRQFEASFFTNIHKLGFIQNKDARDLVLTMTTTGIFVVSLLGIVLFFLTRPRSRY
jgi:hypothetical protein